MLSSRDAVGDTRDDREGRQHDRHGAPQTGPGQEDLFAPGIRKPASETTTDSGLATQQQDQPDDDRRAPSRRHSRWGRPAGRGGRTGRSARASRALRRTNGSPNGVAVRNWRARPRPDRPRGTRWRGRCPLRRTRPCPARKSPRGYRPEAGSAMRRSAIEPRKPQPSPITAPGQQLVYELGERVRRSTARSGTTLNIRTRMTAGASLNPDSASSSPATRRGRGTHAQHREHRRRVGRRHDGAEQQGQLPVHPEQQVRARGRYHHADRRRRWWPARRRARAPCGCRRSGSSGRLRSG